MDSNSNTSTTATEVEEDVVVLEPIASGTTSVSHKCKKRLTIRTNTIN